MNDELEVGSIQEIYLGCNNWIDGLKPLPHLSKVNSNLTSVHIFFITLGET